MNRVEAKDKMFGMAATGWAQATERLNIDADIRFKDDGEPEPLQGRYWARVSRVTVSEEQETLRNAEGLRRWLTVGIIYVQIFCPRQDDGHQDKAELLAEDMRNLFRDYTCDPHLEFTQATIDDNVPPEPAWLAVTVSARFWYRQFR